jgi:CPA2 family monovalent cation:H+ antiporter-2
MLLVLPVLASTEGAGLRVFATLLAAAAGIAAIVFTARTVVPWMLRQILRLGSRELFFGAVVLSCFGAAWLTASLGLSLAIGAFVAGLVVSESEYSHQVFADVLPLRDLFSSVFFVSIGMLLDLSYVATHAAPVALLVVGLVAVKVLIAGGAVLAFVPSPRVALLVGAALGQVGEFSFLLAEESRQLGILEAEDFRAVLAASVFTMMLSPALLHGARALAERAKLPAFSPRPRADEALPRQNHVVIVGYGFNGRNLARVLRETSIPYVVVDFGAERARAAAADHHHAVYGDATRPSVLRHVHASRASVVVLAIDDRAAARRIVRLVREMNANAALVVRTRYVTEIEELTRLGADEVIPEEMETSVELFARVLQRLDVPPNVIAAQVDVVRAEHYAMLRGSSPSAHRIESIYELFTAATTATHLVRAASPAVGRSLGELDLKGRTGITVVAVVRKGKAVTNPPGDWRLARGDILVVLGDHAQLAAARRLLEPPLDASADA